MLHPPHCRFVESLGSLTNPSARDIFPEPSPTKPTKPSRARTSHRHTHSYTNAAARRSNDAEPRPSSATSALSARSSPLESASAVIGPMIPERRSSLRNNTGFRRFRIASLAASLTLSTLPSLPSVMSSLGRRGKEKGGEGKSTGTKSKPGASKRSEDRDTETDTKTATATENTYTDSEAGIEMRDFSADRPNRNRNPGQERSQEGISYSSISGRDPAPPPAPILQPAQPVLQTTEATPRVGSPAAHRIEERQPSVLHHSMSASIVQSDTASAPSSSALATRSATSVLEARAPAASGAPPQPRPRPQRSGPRTQVAPPEGRNVRIGQPGLVPPLWNGATVPTALPDLIADSSTDRDTQPTPPPRFDPSIYSLQARPFIARPMEYLPGYMGQDGGAATAAAVAPDTQHLAAPAPTLPAAGRVQPEAERARQQVQHTRSRPAPLPSLAGTRASRARAQRAQERRREFATRLASTSTATLPTYRRPPPSGTTTMVHPAFRHGAPQGIDNNRWRDSGGPTRPVSGQSVHQHAAASRPQSRLQSQHQRPSTASSSTATTVMGFFSAGAVEGNPNVTVTADGGARVSILLDGRDNGEGGPSTGLEADAQGGSINSIGSMTTGDGSDGAEIGVAVPLAVRISGAQRVRASVVTSGRGNGGGGTPPS